jgi:hypothetical protein
MPSAAIAPARERAALTAMAAVNPSVKAAGAE